MDIKPSIEELLGDIPSIKNIKGNLIEKNIYDGYTLETYLLDINGIDPVPAYFAKPINYQGKLPLVVYNHSHGGKYEVGKKEFIQGNSYLQSKTFAKELTDLGYASFCIDMWGFNERSGITEGELVKEMTLKGQVLWGMMINDNRKALDFFSSLPEIDSTRIATIGMSMGALMAWWFGAVDKRIKCVVDIAGQVDFETLIEKRGLGGHGFYLYVPKLLKYYTTFDVQKMIVPRARLSLTGRYDRQSPMEGVLKLNKLLSKAYNEAGKIHNLKMYLEGCGHMETAGMRNEWKRFLKENL